MGSSLACVITTIRPPTASVQCLATVLRPLGVGLIVVGDRKGPLTYTLDGARFLPFAEQLGMPFRLAKILPANHYSRKNLGYLLAHLSGARVIYETDDDNAPKETWQPRVLVCTAQPILGRAWANVYRFFSDDLLWPRGFPLARIHDLDTFANPGSGCPVSVEAPIQLGLHDGSPDADAVWRLLFDKPVIFNRTSSIWLPPGTWCPFNSQSTWWWRSVHQLMYLPSFCTLRMTDILRGFVAQRCLWALQRGLVFHGPEVYQDRNVHDLISDFRDEIPGYLNNEKIVEALGALDLRTGPHAIGENLIQCYERLVSVGLLEAEELPLVRAWIDDIESAATPSDGDIPRHC